MRGVFTLAAGCEIVQACYRSLFQRARFDAGLEANDLLLEPINPLFEGAESKLLNMLAESRAFATFWCRLAPTPAASSACSLADADSRWSWDYLYHSFGHQVSVGGEDPLGELLEGCRIYQFDVDEC